MTRQKVRLSFLTGRESWFINKMEKSKLIILLAVIVLIFLIAFMSIKTLTIQGFSVSEEKCSSLADNNADDCWHSLAHQTLNNTYCNKIKDNETKEHCFTHIPDINKEDK